MVSQRLTLNRAWFLRCVGIILCAIACAWPLQCGYSMWSSNMCLHRLRTMHNILFDQRTDAVPSIESPLLKGDNGVVHSWRVRMTEKLLELRSMNGEQERPLAVRYDLPWSASENQGLHDMPFFAYPPWSSQRRKCTVFALTTQDGRWYFEHAIHEDGGKLDFTKMDPVVLVDTQGTVSCSPAEPIEIETDGCMLWIQRPTGRNFLEPGGLLVLRLSGRVQHLVHCDTDDARCKQINGTLEPVIESVGRESFPSANR